MQVLIEGQAIKHELYGMGVVMESNSERTTIDFEDYGFEEIRHQHLGGRTDR